MQRRRATGRRPRRRTLATLRTALVALVLAGCRYDVRLDEPRDAPMRDAGRDVGVVDAPDVPSFDVPDAPMRACLGGLPLLALASAPTSAAISFAQGVEGRFALLLPPPLTGPAALLVRVDRDGTVLSSRELTILDGAGEVTGAITLHRRQDRPGYVLLGPTELRPLDPMGDDDGAPIPLPLAPAPGFQRAAGWIDPEHFVYVGDGPGQPLVRVRITTSERLAEVGAVSTEGAARVWIGGGAVTIADLAPSTMVREHDVSLGAPTLALAWPDGMPLAERLFGAFTGTERRWLVSDGSEFRTGVGVYRVDGAGATPIGSGTLLLGPVDVVQHRDLVSTLSGDGTVRAYDFARERFYELGSTTAGFALIERDGTGFVWVTALDTMLHFRCVEDGG